MYAFPVNKPYIVNEEDAEMFFQNSEKQKSKSSELASIFSSKDFQFSQDENGFLSAVQEVEIVE